jgi:glycosyltransferase involved in cell wall biosynthesis
MNEIKKNGGTDYLIRENAKKVEKGEEKSDEVNAGVLANVNMEGVPYAQRPLYVTYIGSLVPQKGFHVLAKAWTQVIQVCPDAVLNVIGTGKLYNRNSQLGSFGIADANYEKEFMPYLIDENEKLLPSVKFRGILGTEKNKILENTRVGVPNPWGKTETFGYTAVELQACGALVTTVKCPGYLETVAPHGGILYDNQKKLDKVLAQTIVTLLEKDENNYDETLKFLELNFDSHIVAAQWNQLFMDIVNEKIQVPLPIQRNANFRMKKWKEINRKIKNRIPFGYKILPSLWYLDDVLWKLGVLLKRDHILKHLWYKYVLKNNPLF